MIASTLALSILQAIAFGQTTAAPRPADAHPLGPAKSFHITRWTMEDGLPQSTVTAIAQARDGYMWLGTFGGLVRFDGVKFKTFTMEDTPELTTNRIVSLCEDRDGTLWIGTENGGLLRRIDDRFEKVADVHATGVVWQIVQDGAGDIWVCCNQVVRIRDGGWEIVNPFPDNADTRVRTLHVDAFKHVWMGSRHSIIRSTNNGFDIIPIAPLDGEQLKIVTTPTGTPWLIASNGIGYLDETDHCRVVTDEGSTHPACGIIDNQGDLLFSHKNGDIGVLRDGKPLSRIQIESRPEQIGRRIGIRALYQSGDGIIWAGTNIGLLRMAAEPYFRAGTELQLKTGVRHLFNDGGDGVYLEPESPQCILHWDGERLHRFEPGALKGLTYWRSIGASKRGVFVADLTDTWRLSPDGLQHVEGIGPALGATEDPDGTLWFLCQNRVAWEKDGRRGEIEISTQAGCRRTTSLFKRTRDGALWFTSGSHLVRLGPERTAESITSFGIDDGLPESDVRSLHQDRSGDIWIATYGTGLFRLRNGVFTAFGTAEGMPDTNLGGILEDDHERLWVNSNRGVIVIPIASLNAVADQSESQLTCRVLATGEVNGLTACRTPDGRMWFPTIDDLIIANPAAYRSNAIPPRVVIENVDVDGARLQPAKAFDTIISGSNIQFEYTAFSYTHPKQLRFRCRLENYDADWRDVGNRRTAYYTRVPPGEYAFRVLAANEDGIWCESPAQFRLRVNPRFFETTPFRVGVVLSILGLLALAHRHRVSLHRRHATALAAEIRQREQSETERRRLEKMLRESTKLEAVGRLAGGIAHDFNNVLAAILGSADVLQHQLSKKLGDEPDSKWRESLDCISASGQRAARLTRQLLAYSRRLVLRPTTIDANDVITKLLPMLRQLLPDDIELTTELTNDFASTRVDVTQLEQVVMNLVLNAREAIAPPGTIHISTAVTTIDAGGDHATRIRSDAPYVMIAISDTGEGISDEALPRIFEPFFTTRFEQGGAGLGLATVQGVVYQSGGHIFVDNTAECGTTFRIYLPRADCTAVEPSTSAVDDDVAASGSETILVCEDDEQVRRLACKSLERAGYVVLEAALPSQARLLFSNNGKIDLLITDVVLPVEDGFALAAGFAQSHPDAKTLFVSGYANAAFEMPEFSESNTRFLGKPFLPQTLLREVRRILDET
ncbi:MAG: response regulator [Phycisphaerales bacterium]|nr:response regulator [Phycisphaerales bacterium]MCB9856185.1 response regulator [Phycisphaerales bacterium]MCB9863375.1 response regulator [Phycisphaerales bacterium]